MQNNLATDIIKKLKRKIRILVALLVISSLLSAGLSIAYVRKASMCAKCKEKVINNQAEAVMPEMENKLITIQKRRVKDGKTYTIQSQPTRKQSRGLYCKSNIKSS